MEIVNIIFTQFWKRTFLHNKNVFDMNYLHLGNVRRLQLHLIHHVDVPPQGHDLSSNVRSARHSSLTEVWWIGCMMS